jgi:hypothetical protein
MTLHIPDVSGMDTIAAACAYADAGWYVLPVDPKVDGKHPGSVVGKSWQTKSSRDHKVIAAWFAATDYLLALHCGRSGAVVFDVDSPARIPEVLAPHTGGPFQSTRPDQFNRGHYPFLQPEGRLLGNGKGRLGSDWGDVRGLNGIIMVAPGPNRRWIRTGPLAPLPAEVAAKLPNGKPGEDSATDAVVAAFIAEHTAASRPGIEAARVNGLLAKIEAGEGRHTSAVPYVTGALEEARAGFYSAQVVLDALKPIFVNAVQLDSKNRRTAEQAENEWDGIVAWAVGQALAADLEEIRARVEAALPDPVTVIEFDPEPPPAEDPKRLPYDVTHLEDGFWDSRDSLKAIYDAALGRMCAPWAVLAHCAARALMTVRPCATLPPLIGGPASLNSFFAVVAPSGGGKSAAAAVARELINQPFEQRALGSGEGFLESYLRPEDKETGEPAGYHEAIMFLADESDTVSALSGRSGSTLLSTLRTAWDAGSLSFGYRGRTRDSLAAHTYRTTLIMAMQPSKAGWMLDDDGGGTPQRFMWWPGIDPRITVERWTGEYPAALVLPSWREWEYSITLTVPDEARDVIITEHAKRQSGNGQALDGHALQCREKFAYALTVLDGRTEMTLEDWELAGIASAVSTHIRGMVQVELDRSRRSRAADEGAIRGVGLEAADNERTMAASQRVHRVLRNVLAKLDAADGRQLKEREITKLIANRDRGALRSALQLGLNDGLLEKFDDTAWRKL